MKAESLHRGDVWWAELAPPEKTRPVVLVSREEAYAVRRLVTVAYVTTRQRGIPTHVSVGRDEGLSREGVVNCDQLNTVPRTLLSEKIGSLGPAKMGEVDEALRLALGLD